MDEKFDKERLSKNDGKEDRPAYIVHGGRVIDVTKSPLWKSGTHMARHHAGRDLTSDIQAAPHGLDVLDRYPQVGVFSEETALQEGLPPLVSALLARYPFLKRHPHPASVHFPIVFTLSASFFSILYLLTGNRSFDQTAFYCLTGALLFTPLAILTGLFTWWINYMARPMWQATVKKYLSVISFGVMLCLFCWNIAAPVLPGSFSAPSSILYFGLVIALSPAIFVVAYYGGTLTFPIDKG